MRSQDSQRQSAITATPEHQPQDYNHNNGTTVSIETHYCHCQLYRLSKPTSTISIKCRRAIPSSSTSLKPTTYDYRVHTKDSCLDHEYAPVTTTLLGEESTFVLTRAYPCRCNRLLLSESTEWLIADVVTDKLNDEPKLAIHAHMVHTERACGVVPPNASKARRPNDDDDVQERYLMDKVASHTCLCGALMLRSRDVPEWAKRNTTLMHHKTGRLYLAQGLVHTRHGCRPRSATRTSSSRGGGVARTSAMESAAELESRPWVVPAPPKYATHRYDASNRVAKKSWSNPSTSRSASTSHRDQLLLDLGVTTDSKEDRGTDADPAAAAGRWLAELTLRHPLER